MKPLATLHLCTLTGLALAIVMLKLATPSLQAQTLTVQADSWMPIDGDPADKDQGYAIDLLHAIFEPQTKVEFTNVSWTVALDNARQGKVDAVVGAVVDEAPTLVFPSESIGRSRACLWAAKDSKFVYTDVNSLKGLTIGVIEGYTYWPELDALIKSGAVKTVTFLEKDGNPLDNAINALADHKIDLYPEAAVVMAYATQAKHMDLDADFTVKYDHESRELYVAFANNDKGKKLAAQWDAGIATLRKNGGLAKILAKYGLPDWK